MGEDLRTGRVYWLAWQPGQGPPPAPGDENCLYSATYGKKGCLSEDTSKLPPGLRLAVGKLYPSKRTRRFVGQLDELAIYNRALSPEEIASHYRPVHPAVVSPVPSI